MFLRVDGLGDWDRFVNKFFYFNFLIFDEICIFKLVD